MNRLLSFALGGACLLLSACAPTVAFTADPTGGVQPLKVKFTDKSATLAPGRINMNAVAPIYDHVWDFGDGTGSTAEDPEHTYNIAGEYTVSLTVSNPFGTETLTKASLIKVTTPASSPTARFEFTVDAENPLRLTFSDKSAPGSRPITSWLWDFGDNTTSAEQNPTHVYAAAGIYKVALRVTTVVGSDSTEREIPVSQETPAADFRWQVDSANSLSIIFTDESVAGSQPVTAWEWSFGDDTTSAERNPRHTYASAGSYSVRLKVTTRAGVDEATHQVNVQAATTGGEGEAED
jgi:PKD repeat protein